MSAVLIYGELLFDQFPSGETVLGGAPMNVAWHLNALGFAVTMVSRVGKDELGRQARSVLQKAGLDTSEIQTDEQYPTGTVDIQLTQGSPSFDIVNDVAYDHIQLPAAPTLNKDYALLYHGSLALRNPVSRKTLEEIYAHIACPIFVDVNLRAPFWSIEQIQQLISRATWAKLNHEELAMLSGIVTTQQRDELIEVARSYRNQNALQALIVTCGAEGAFIVTEQDIYDMLPVIPEAFLDTVGAGDAFSAITIAGILQRWSYQKILEQASQFAARICGIRGAIPDKKFKYPDIKHLA